MKIRKYVFSVAFVVASSAAHADLDCSFVGGKIENVARAADTSSLVERINNVNGKLETLIKICGGMSTSISDEFIHALDINDGIKKEDIEKSNCDPSTVGGQSENGVRHVQAQIGKAQGAANTASNNADELAKVLLRCIKGK